MLFQLQHAHSQSHWLWKTSEFPQWICIKNTACQSWNLFPLHSSLALNNFLLMHWNLALLYFSAFIKKGAIPVFSLSYPSKGKEKPPSPKQCSTCNPLTSLHKAQCCHFWERIASNKAWLGGWTNPGYWEASGLPCWAWAANTWVLSSLSTASMQEPWECRSFWLICRRDEMASFFKPCHTEAWWDTSSPAWNHGCQCSVSRIPPLWSTCCLVGLGHLNILFEVYRSRKDRSPYCKVKDAAVPLLHKVRIISIHVLCGLVWL